MLGTVQNVLYEIVKAVWDFIIDAIYVAVLIVWGVIQFALGLFLRPVDTIRGAIAGTIAVANDLYEIFKSWFEAFGMFYRRYIKRLPVPIRVLILLAAVCVVMMLSNHMAAIAKMRARQAAIKKLQIPTLDSYRTDIERDIETAAPVKVRSGWRNTLKWLRDQVWSSPTSELSSGEESRRPTTGAPKWKYDPDTNQWRWMPSDGATGGGDRAADSNSGSYGSDGEGGGTPKPPRDSPLSYDDDDTPAPTRRRRRVPLDDEELEQLIDRNTKAEQDEESQLLRKIEHLKARDRLGELRVVVEELQQRRKLRQQMQNEYDWADEVEAHRELQREQQRKKWLAEERKWARMRRAITDGGDEAGAVDNAVEDNDDGHALVPVVPPTSGGSRCHVGPVVVPLYSEFLRDRVTQPDYAYVTYVSSSEYVQGAAVLMYSIAMTGSQYARAIAVTKDIGARDRELLGKLAQVIEIERVAHPHHISNAHYIDTFTKLRIWELAMYRKVVYIDVDVIVLRNLDDMFDLSEWSVPMDAEQSRYSTGMMVCEPKLSTFDDMISKLQTTSVSMELPDLLFLKEYFDSAAKSEVATNTWSRKPARRINIIPRWYQVYQEEFGSQYSTYLTSRKQKLTIYDKRIHGLHYPGNNKPWHQFSAHWAKYSSHFCHWRNNENFIYDPKFLWYAHYAWLKNFLKQHSQAAAFEYEQGSGVINLAAWSAEERKKSAWTEAPANPYSGGRYKSKYDWDPSPATPDPTKHRVWDSPATKAPVRLGLGDWEPASCVIRRPVATSPAAPQASTAAAVQSTDAAHDGENSVDGAATTTAAVAGSDAPTGTTAAAEDSKKPGSQDSALDAASSSSSSVDGGGAPPTTSAAATPSVKSPKPTADASTTAAPPTALKSSTKAATTTAAPSTVAAKAGNMAPTPSVTTKRKLQGLFTPLESDDSDSDSGSVDSGGAAPDLAVTKPATPTMAAEAKATAAPTPKASLDPIVVDLGTLHPLALRLPQAWAGAALEPYVWVVTWCTPRKIKPVTQGECGQASYVAQYSGGFCRANFAESLSMHLLTSPSDEVLGVVLRSHVTLSFPPRKKLIEVVVRCDSTMTSETDALLDDTTNSSRVVVESVRLPHDRRYTMHLRSRCACAGGCGQAKKTAAALSGTSPTTDMAAVRKWAASTFGSAVSPFPPRSAFKGCFSASVDKCLELPGCDYLVTKKKCVPSTATQWIKYSDASSGKYSNCTHVGGNAVEVVTLEQCQVIAVKAGANVVNYGAWPEGSSPVPDTPPPKGETRTIVSGCYYKKCAARALWQGAPSVRRAKAKDEAGFDVHFLNPFYLSEDDAAAFEKVGAS